MTPRGDEDEIRFNRDQAPSREPDEEFVGRVAGEDAGYEEETGAERRAREEGTQT
ncbi:MAG TPA: hypothetical protein VHC43_06550 [Mycobacteriales bacterium]|nr:hypothetical protein [Mycobacteriales bacterium]